MNKERFKNPWFWIGLIGVALTAMGVSPETFTSWAMVGEAVRELLNNPYLLFTTASALLGVFVDPTTKGLKDGGKDGI